MSGHSLLYALRAPLYLTEGQEKVVWCTEQTQKGWRVGVENILRSKRFFALFWPIFGHFWPIFGLFLSKYPLYNPRFLWRRVGLRSGWCGNAPMLFLKSIGVGLDRVGGDQRRCRGEFWRFLAIFGHFWPLLALFGPFWAKNLLENPRFLWRTVGSTSRGCGNGPMLHLKSIEVGLDRVGGDQRRFGGEFWRFFVIFAHFWSFLDQKFL